MITPVTTVLIAADLHRYSENSDVGSPTDRLVAAMANVPGVPHPLGGSVARPDAVLLLGDLIHEGLGSETWLDTFPDSVACDGNHDQDHVRDYIIAKHGSLTHGVKIGPAWFQFMTETYTSPVSNSPPTAAQINGAVATSLAARPANEPTFFCVHRSMSTPGYRSEWEGYVNEGTQGPALDALKTLADAHNTLGIIHGHDHLTFHTAWRGHRTWSPGSVRMAPEDPPYSSIFPETFLVLRIADTWYDVASLIFGFDTNRPISGGVEGGAGWVPGTWEWAERVPYYPTGSGLSVQSKTQKGIADRESRRVVYDLYFDRSYATGGLTLDCSKEFSGLHAVQVEARSTGYVISPNRVTRTAQYAQGRVDLQVFRQNATTGALQEVPATTDLSTLRVIVHVDGE